MSKAFTRESDDGPEEPISRSRAPLPAGVKNYMTSAGAQRLGDERERLVQQVRPGLLDGKRGASSTVDALEARRRLQALDARAREIEEILESAVIVPPATQNADRVHFGARVGVRNGHGEEFDCQIVGVDEAAAGEGRISWLSPMAKALMNARTGDTVALCTPDGEVKLTVLRVCPG